jgi:[acyl-carrier-protein] S-malonyltransferase
VTYGFVFPGQGSQEIGMLGDFLQSEPIVRACVAEAEAAVGIPLGQLMREGPAEELNRTRITQPVLLTASIALWRLWLSRGGRPPVVMAGHSLGEYSALVAAGALDFAEAVRLVAVRGELMQAAVPSGAGAMAAILGLDEAQVIECCSAVDGVVSAANINAPGQIVIAGTAAAVAAASERCLAAGAMRAIKLEVSVPSHCSLMLPAAERFVDAIAKIRVTAPSVPVVHNVDAVATSDPDHIRRNLLAQLSQPVRWIQCVESMVRQGATTLVECGPGKILGGMIRRIDRSVVNVALGTRAGFDAALQGAAARG